MKMRNGFLSVLLSGLVLATPTQAAVLRKQMCDNPTYRKNNPDKCKNYDKKSFSFATTGMFAGTTLAAIGTGIAVLGATASSSNDSSQTTAPVIGVNPVPVVPNVTTPAYKPTVDDITEDKIVNEQSSNEYNRNAVQYNAIGAAYSLARGYTGKNSTIAILDTGYDVYHGQKVTQIASGPIAPDAIVNSYKIIDGDRKFLPFAQIGDIINDADDANIYNASWVLKNKYANQIRNRQDLVRLTDEKFISAIETATYERDAIFVWAAGNNGRSESNALAALGNVSDKAAGHIVNVVAWDDETGALADFSNACGVTMNYCITAPGTNLSAGVVQSNSLDGTSFAAPIVSAAIAVIREAFPYMQSTQITSLLFETARDLGANGVDEIYGHGMLDLERATRPVGTEKVAISDSVIRPLETAHVSPALANAIQSENLELAFLDDYGRAFTTPLNTKIKSNNRGRAFVRLRSEEHNTAKFGNIEFGMRTSDFLGADGFLSNNDKTNITFIANSKEYDMGALKMFYRSEFGISNPRTDGQSIISDFSNIYTASLMVGANIGDWTLSVSTNDAIINGTMDMRIPTARADNGAMVFTDYQIDLATQPAIEYNIVYKNITAGFVDNPYGTDEFYIISKHKFVF